MSDKKIELNHVRYAIRDRVILDDISLSIGEGERVAICGPNGAGKSTLINLMLNVPGAGFNARTHKLSGQIQNTLFDTRSYRDVKVHLQNSQISYNLYLKVGELLKLCFGDEIPTELIGQMGLKDKLNNLVRTLSGGELQKLNIILVIASKPKVIFLDEMTTGLDYEARRDILTYVRDYVSGSACTLVLVTHYLEEISGLADKVYFLEKGKVVEQGDLNGLYQKYAIADSDICRLYEEVIIHEQDRPIQSV